MATCPTELIANSCVLKCDQLVLASLHARATGKQNLRFVRRKLTNKQVGLSSCSTDGHQRQMREQGTLFGGGIGEHCKQNERSGAKAKTSAIKTRSGLQKARRDSKQDRESRIGVDLDGDGIVDESEIALSRLIDQNGDGSISMKEVQKFATNRNVSQIQLCASGDQDTPGQNTALLQLQMKLAENQRRRRLVVFPAATDECSKPERRKEPTLSYVPQPKFTTRSSLLAARRSARVSKWGRHGEHRTICCSEYRDKKPTEIDARGFRQPHKDDVRKINAGLGNDAH